MIVQRLYKAREYKISDLLTYHIIEIFQKIFKNLKIHRTNEFEGGLVVGQVINRGYKNAFNRCFICNSC